MNFKFLMFLLVPVAACSTGRRAERVPQVPPLAIELPKADLQRDAGSRTDSDQSAMAPVPAEESRPAVEPRSSEPVYRSVVHTVETPAVETQNRVAPEQGVAGGEANDAPQYSAARPRVSYGAGFQFNAGYAFPVHTVIGASVGAAIGHHHGNAHRGAAIGGTVGFFLDLGRVWR